VSQAFDEVGVVRVSLGEAVDLLDDVLANPRVPRARFVPSFEDFSQMVSICTFPEILLLEGPGGVHVIVHLCTPLSVFPQRLFISLINVCEVDNHKISVRRVVQHSPVEGVHSVHVQRTHLNIRQRRIDLQGVRDIIELRVEPPSLGLLEHLVQLILVPELVR
jgi:hypothetical protein